VVTIGDGVLLAFAVFNSLLLLLIGWGLRAGQRALDRRFEQDERALREAMKRWPP
jgi:hypothetical protein